nr:NUDIX domain-containing protein [Ardenticatenales bacterium]
MDDSETKLSRQGSAHHLATPRTLLFLERAGEWLLIEGAAHKWWAGKLNGIGGSVEAGEDIRTAARRECQEETGFLPRTLDLAALIHVVADPSVLLFVFVGELPAGELAVCEEGTFRWFTQEALTDPTLPLMPDLPFLLPRLWAREPDTEPLYFLFD